MRLFVDMDGVLAEYKWSGKGEEWRRGHFLSLAPDPAVVKAVRKIAIGNAAEVYVLSALLPDSDWCRPEKAVWLVRYLPEIPEDRWIFTKPGVSKPEAVVALFGTLEDSILLDDFTANLKQWESAGGTGIKYLNGINGTKGTWQGRAVSSQMLSEEIIAAICP